ncbi:MAG: L-seryl-tRNA(Ser) seleniumtransferase [Clostridiales bacterium]|jgi:L-seryl-tRNA(Ser) seleniumtransferase|nr:L-seryl-tRNA(Ser) seleniumtransferase [Clostridiales bacterium]MDN5298452.1 L-seryl-tRNA(Ser) seleniumtransferase [Clostridiales bacterium]
MQSLYSNIPNMNEILSKLSMDDIEPKWQKKLADQYLQSLRASIASGDVNEINADEVIQSIRDYIKTTLSPGLKRIINGTGVVIHTNLGRSSISKTLLDETTDVLSHYSNLEYSLEKGARGSRYAPVVERLKLLTGAEDAIVVNNNAAAVMLTLNTFASGGSVIVSRGELVEIGGAFRIPEVMKLSGCQLIEVGTTNKTHPYDYSRAVAEDTRMVMKVHTSNYRIQGFTASVETDVLSEITNANGLILYEDLGSGSFETIEGFQEKTIQEAASHCDLLSFSGDKLLGGPQCGIIVGKRDLIAQIKSNQLLRALRVDKFTLSILDRLMTAYFKTEGLRTEAIPTHRYLKLSEEAIEAKVNAFLDIYQEPLKEIKLHVTKAAMDSEVGAGSMPLALLPSCGLIIRSDHSIERCFRSMRLLELPLIGRIEKDGIVLDFRMIETEDFEGVFNALKAGCYHE